MRCLVAEDSSLSWYKSVGGLNEWLGYREPALILFLGISYHLLVLVVGQNTKTDKGESKGRVAYGLSWLPQAALFYVCASIANVETKLRFSFRTHLTYWTSWTPSVKSWWIKFVKVYLGVLGISRIAGFINELINKSVDFVD
eukprot:GHVQ01012798.1.p1 GENE.GHVQ01012798.1~~GHVQ01012798.1.p1  ORF type:complete len:142 (+),score=8.11 GHVQ01012798.1:176-601(+)